MTLRLGDTLVAGSGANQDLSNLTSTGKNIGNWSTNVTNCITEIPQDIKVGLNNGGLYLKAGCKYCVPNGFEQDGVTPHFDFVTVNADSSSTAYGTGRTGCMAVWSTDHFEWNTLDRFHSGSTQPSGDWWVWYDTTTNKIKHYNGSTIVEGVSFPICMITENAGTGYDSTIKSIDHVFNGFGYIGSTVFALPGVKGLIPNGRNEDGSLKNIGLELDKVLTEQVTESLVLTLGSSAIYTGYYYLNEKLGDASYSWCYDEKENLVYRQQAANSGYFTNEEVTRTIYIGRVGVSSNNITSFIPKTAFHALDYNDSSTISGWGMPSGRYIDLTLLASGSQYTAPANGWFYFSKNGTAGGQFAVFEAASDGIAGEISGVSYTVGYVINLLRPVKKGITVKLRYTAQGATNYFRFVYGEGENV